MIPDAEKIQAQLAELRDVVKPDEPAPVLPLTQSAWAYSDRTLPDLLAEHQLTVLRGAVLKWQIRCRRLEAQVDRLEHELAAAMDEAARLRAGSEHAQQALLWGMGG
jgi:hypothetical protein